MDEAIAQVVLVTNCTPERAEQYLRVTDGDADQAVSLYFENGGVDLVAAPSPYAAAEPQPSSRFSGTGAQENPVNLDPDDNISDDNDPDITGYGRARTAPQATYDEDAAMARRMQEEMYGGGPAEETIRAPIARQAETLLGPGADPDMSGLPLPSHIQQRMLEFQNRRGQARLGIFNQAQTTSAIWQDEDPTVSHRDELAQATGGASESSSKSSMLARMFQPPWELMYNGRWEEAREEGRENKKWLMVNIQDGSVFDCQALNRDLWKDPGVVETVRENFIFMQYSKDDKRAEDYIRYYFEQANNMDSYPHISIIDPRTGEQMKVWSRNIPKTSEFLMQLHEFLDRYSLNTNARNPVAKRKSEAKKEKSVEQMSEEEMIEKALRESLATQSQELKPPSVEDPDDLTRSIGDVRGQAKVEGDQADAMSIYENGGTATSTTPFSRIPSDHPHVEPPAGPDVTRVQIRHPAGRVIRRFALTDPVQRIYEFLKAEPLEGKEGVEFELIAMGKNLMDSTQETIEQAGLKNGTVMVEFVDS